MALILLLEDDPLLRQTLEQLLTQFSHEVLCTASGEEAVSLARQHPVELLLCDVRVAGEMDGVEALEQVRRLRPGVRCIVMTGFADVDAPLRAARLQADDYLLKPFKMQALLLSLRGVLSQESSPPDFLMRLKAAPGQAATRALRWFYDAHWKQLQEVREQGMKQFYLLIRSKRLGAAEARAYFATWQELELEYLNNRAPQLWAQQVRAYHEWGQALTRLEGAVPAADLPGFELLYARTQAGLVEVCHLLRAVELLHFPQKRKDSLEEHCLYHWLWAPGEEQGDPFLGISVRGYRLVRPYSGTFSKARMYEAEHELQPGKGDRVLCLEDTPESRYLAQREVKAERTELLASQHDHLFLLYRGYSLSLRARLPGNGLLPFEAWKCLRPVFVQVAAYHGQGRCSGCFSLQDIDWPPAEGTTLTRFSPEPYRLEHQRLREAQGTVGAFLAAPEVVFQSEPTPLSDQAVLGRLLFEVLFGGRYPDLSLRSQLRMLGQPEANQAFAPYVQRLGPLGPVFYRLAQAQPEQRFASLEQALAAGDAAF